ncbi:MAG: GNAT family N-acetyltransferase [Anaerovoracaceae bacterium]
MRIETDRLLLRPFAETDAADIFEYLHAPEVNCFACMRLETMEDARKDAAEKAKDPDLYLAITLKETGKVIGEIFAHPEGTDPESEGKDTWSPCWMLNPAYQGKGYMYEAASAYYDYLFSSMGVRRIYLYTEDYNLSCQKLSEKLGMRKEGLFREFVSFISDSEGHPIYENTYQYAILKKEWESR